MKTYHAARYPYLWVTTSEEERFIREQREQFPGEVQFFSWDIADGLRALLKNGKGWIWKPVDPDLNDPGAALVQVTQSIPENSVIFLKDYHKYFTDISIIRRAINLKDQLKATARLVCFIGAGSPASIPPELTSDITIYQFPMPDRAALERVVLRLCEDNELKAPNGDMGAIVDALTGLTLESAENALCKSLVETKKFDYKSLLDEKAALLKSSVGLSYQRYSETFADLYGLENLKEWCLRTSKSELSRGVLLYGVPGCGKSHFAKALANELKRPCLVADFGALRGKYQGDAEGRLDMMLKSIDAFGPCIVFVDELDKALAGTGSADTDGGVGQRILMKLLTYFQDRAPGGAYWVCTCNSLEEILSLSGGALVRRFDSIFFVDMPTDQEARGIAAIWAKKMGVIIPGDYDFSGFSGADIAKLATNMKMLNAGPEVARKYLVPSSQSIGTKIEEIRKRAKNVCIWASDVAEKTQASGRKVNF